MLPKITDNTKPNMTTRLEDLVTGTFFKFVNGGDTRLYRKPNFNAHDDAKKLFDASRLVELVETGELVVARKDQMVYEVEVEVIVKRIIN